MMEFAVSSLGLGNNKHAYANFAIPLSLSSVFFLDRPQALSSSVILSFLLLNRHRQDACEVDS